MAESITEVYARRRAYFDANKKNHDEGLVADTLQALQVARAVELADEQALVAHVRERGCKS